MSRMNVSLPQSCLDELRERVPDRQRSRFIAEAVREKLARLDQLEAVRSTAGSWSNEGRGDASEEIRRGRQEWPDVDESA